MSVCATCGMGGVDGAAFCPSCGAPQGPSPRTVPLTKTRPPAEVPPPVPLPRDPGDGPYVTPYPGPVGAGPAPDPWRGAGSTGPSATARGSRRGPVPVAVAVAAVVAVAAGLGVTALLSDGEPRASVTEALPADDPGSAPQPAPSDSAPADSAPTGPEPGGPEEAAEVSRPLQPADAFADCAAAESQDAAGRTTSFGPEQAVDGLPETAWRCSGSAVGRRLVLEFAEPVTVTSLGLIPGYAKVDPLDGTDRFAQNRTVTAVQWSFDDGSVHHQEVLRPTPELARTVLDEPVTTSTVTLTIASTGNDRAERDYTPISEVEVVGR